MMHSFDVDHAVRFGVLEAILIHHFQHWIAKNAANGVNQHDGYTWTYNSVKAYGELFPYFSARQVAGALKHLVTLGILQVGHYGEDGRNRTNWYTFTKNADEILAVSIMQKLHNASDKNCTMQCAEIAQCNVQKCQMSNVLRNTLLSTTSNIPTDGEEEDIYNNNITTPAGAREGDDPFPPRKRALSFGEERDLNTAEWYITQPGVLKFLGEGVKVIRRMLGSDRYPMQLITYAVERARQRDERFALGDPVAYIMTLLNDWTNQGFETVEDVQEARDDWGHYA